MVLQRGKPVPVWGTASPGESVTVSFKGQSVSTTADSQGNWLVTLASMSADASSKTMTITGNNTVSITGVLVGDVWICSGQSNMAFSLGGCNRQVDINAANYPGIRTFWVPLVTSDVPLKTLSSGSWTVCSPSTASGFSATAFYFARSIYLDQGATIPIGIIVSSVGGTRIDPWLAPDGIYDIPVLNPLLSQSVLPYGPFSLFNGMIHPLAPYGITGAIWYQGENSETTVQSTDSYFLKMKALAQGWKRLWGMDDFAYYFVMIANWGTLPSSSTPVLFSGGWDADTRLQQTNAMAIPHSGMGSALDVGETADMHPKDKLDVGERLAMWALKNEYGHSSLLTSGPVLKDAILSGSSVICSFDYVGSGLMVGSKTPYLPTQEVIGGTLDKFVIAGTNNVWYAANAVIDTNNNTVIMSSPSVPSPRKISYACWQNPLGCNLYNREGLPAAPFHIDDITIHYTITATAGAGGSISPAGVTSMLKRMTKLYTITPDPNYYISDVRVDGVSVGSVKNYTFDPIYANHTIEAFFSTTAPTYTITASSGGGGSLSPVGDIVVPQGGSASFTITPESGNLTFVTVDGVSLGQRSSFSFTDVRNNHTIAAVFKCPVTATSGFGGTISPFGTSQASYGTDKTYTITPISGYSIHRVIVDGNHVGAVPSYTFSNVTRSHTITAAFIANAGIGTGSVPQTSQIIFACLADVLPASGNTGAWPLYIPSGQSLAVIGSPTAETIDSRRYEKNMYLDADGYRFGSSFSSPIACTGASIVAVARPMRYTVDAPWTSIVDIFYDRLVLGIRNDNGKVVIRRNGTTDTSTSVIPEGQVTILSYVVQSNGNYKVWANGTLVLNKTTTSTMTSLVPGPNGYDTYMNVGRNNPDSWTTFNGHIGDVFVYKTALSDSERQQLENFIKSYLSETALNPDLDKDGDVDSDDLKILTERWLWTGISGSIDEDIVRDGLVDFFDYSILANFWMT